MKAVILVGGEGTRLQPLTCQKPKAMMPVLNKPFLGHVVERLKKHSVDTVILTLCYLPDSLKEYLGDGEKFGLKILYINEEQPLGTAGAVKNAEKYLDTDFFVLNGDIYTDLDLGAMLDMHLKNKAFGSIALTPVKDPSAYGVVETNEGNRIKRFIEKPKPGEATSNMVNAGTYILNPRVLKDIPVNTPFSFERKLFPLLLEKGEALYAFPSNSYWIDIGTPEKYTKLNFDLLDPRLNIEGKPLLKAGLNIGIGTEIDKTAEFRGAVFIGNNTVIQERVEISGPSIIGNDCNISSGAKLEGVILWDNVFVGNDTVLKNCIIGNDCKIHDNCRLGEGCVLANNIAVMPGCVIEAHSKIWPDSVVQP